MENMPLILAAGIIIAAAVLAAAIGMAILGSSFLTAIARQPEMSNVLMSRFFLVVGLVDAMPFIGLAVSLSFYNPFG